MWSACSSFHVLLPVPPWKHTTTFFLSSFILTNPSSRNTTKFHSHMCGYSSKDDFSSSSPNQSQLQYDPLPELLGLDLDIPPRDMKSDSSRLGPKGQYIRELPCPTCRGRGYTPCSGCGVGYSRKNCSLCSGKGIITCQQCLGERVIWAESLDEKPWEKAHAISPLKVEEDELVDNLDLKLNARKKSKRVYRSLSPEVRLKMSQSLKSLNAKTGLLSERMKSIHRDPVLRAQRVAAIKRAKETPAARKHASETMKAFFSDPENRRKRSIAMIGVKFFCKNCGREGHRRNHCPELGKDADRRHRCALCKKRGHHRSTCQRRRMAKTKQRVRRAYQCWACGQVGHNSRTCTQKTTTQSDHPITLYQRYRSPITKQPYRCRLCGQGGHSRRFCPWKTKVQSDSEAIATAGSLEDSRTNIQRQYAEHVDKVDITAGLVPRESPEE